MQQQTPLPPTQVQPPKPKNLLFNLISSIILGSIWTLFSAFQLSGGIFQGFGILKPVDIIVLFPTYITVLLVFSGLFSLVDIGKAGIFVVALLPFIISSGIIYFLFLLISKSKRSKLIKIIFTLIFLLGLIVYFLNRPPFHYSS